VEQRYKAVREVLEDGATVTDVARRYGVGRQAVHSWLRRYAAEGMAGLVDRSARPDTCPHQMPPDVEARVLELRRFHPSWGPRTILNRLTREGIDPLPGRSSIYRALVRHHLIEPNKRRRRPSDYKRWERSRPMELWQMDITAGVYLADGSQASIVTGIDDHSRFCVCAKVVERATAKPVCDALRGAMEVHGVPEAILTELNGKVFTGRFGPGHGTVLFDRICQENGIRHLLTAPRSPTTTGKVERFHKTLKEDFLGGQIFDSIEDAQAQIDAWVREYNSIREHQSLGDRPPAERFAMARPKAFEPPADPPPTAPGPLPRLLRRVRTDGTVSLLNCKYHVGRYLAGQNVNVGLNGGLVEIYSDSVLVATHARKHPPELDESVHRRALAAPPARPRTEAVVIRKVDNNGAVRFAGTTYFVGQAYRRRQLEVGLLKDTVQIWDGDRLLRTHPIRHDRRKEHGAFANPSGRPDRINAA
jgi:transposase InsO family protein